MPRTITTEIIREDLLRVDFQVQTGLILVTYAEVTADGRVLSPRSFTISRDPRPATARGPWFVLNATEKAALTTIAQAIQRFKDQAVLEPEPPPPDPLR